MPRLAVPQVVARGQAEGGLRGQSFQGVDVRGLMAGAGAVGEGFERMRANQDRAAEELRQAQERAAERLAMDEARSYVANATSRADELWRTRMDEARQRAPKDAAGLTAGVLKDWDAWAEKEVQQAPERARSALRDDLARMRSQVHAQLFQFEVKQRQEAIKDDFNDSLNADLKTAMADPLRAPDLIAKRTALSRVLSLPEGARQEMAEKAREGLAAAAAQGMIDQNPAAFLERAGVRSAKGPKGQAGSHAEDAAERIAADPILSAMRPDHLRQAIDNASMRVAQQEAAEEQRRERARREAEAAEARRARAADQAWNILSGPLMAGFAIDEKRPENVAALAAIQGTPYAEAYRGMVGEASRRNAAAVLPMPAQRAQLQQLYAQRNTEGTSSLLDAEIKRREEVLHRAESDYKGDAPLTAAIRRGVPGMGPQLVPVDTSSASSLAKTIAPRVAQAKALSDHLGGAPVSPLESAEVEPIARALQSLPPAQKAAYVAEVSAALPAWATVGLARQIAPSSRAAELAFKTGANRTSLGRLTSELVFAGEQAMKDGTSTKGKKEPEVLANRWKATIMEKMGDVFPDQAVSNDARDAALYIAHAKAAEAGGSVDLDQAVSLALHGTLAEGRGRTVMRDDRPFRVGLPLPVGVDESMLDRRLASVKPLDIARALTARDGQPLDLSKAQVVAGGAPMAVADFLRELPRMELAPVRPGVYTPIVNGRPVFGPGGRVEIEVR